MRSHVATRWMMVTLLAASLVFPAGVRAQAATSKPPLSAEVAKAIDQGGLDAGQRRFDELFPQQKDDYELDIRGFYELGAKYMQGGNIAAGQQIMAMAAAVAQDVTAASMGMEPPSPRQAAPAKKEQPRPRANPLGPSREDLARFMGLYGDPNRTDKNRTLWVSTTCDGHLAGGASWGDASPWFMRSTSDTAFEATDFGGKVLSFEFRTGSDGNAQAMVHGLDHMPNPLPRLGPLPKDWQECIQPPEFGR